MKEKLATKFSTIITANPVSAKSQIQTKDQIIMFFSLKNRRYIIANVFWVDLF